MKYIIVIFSLFLSLPVFSQELEKCGFGLINNKPSLPRIFISENENYMVKMDWKLGAKIYELNDSNYQFKKIIKLKERSPNNILITNKGDLVVYGRRGLLLSGTAQSDVVYIYKNLGESLKTINADMVFSKEEIQKSILKYEKSSACTPTKPWICHSFAPELFNHENELVIYGTLNRMFQINLDTFEIKIEESSDECELFDLDT